MSGPAPEPVADSFGVEHRHAITDAHADNPACPNCHPEPSADCGSEPYHCPYCHASPNADCCGHCDADPDAESDPESYAAPAY